MPFNLVTRGDNESLTAFLAKFKNALLSLVRIGNTDAMASPEHLLCVETGAMEIRGDRAVFLDRDGETVVGEIPLSAEEGEKRQNFGLGPKAQLRLEIDPMDREKAQRILAGRVVEIRDGGKCYVHGKLTADELEALAWYVRRALA